MDSKTSWGGYDHVWFLGKLISLHGHLFLFHLKRSDMVLCLLQKVDKAIQLTNSTSDNAVFDVNWLSKDSKLIGYLIG